MDDNKNDQTEYNSQGHVIRHADGSQEGAGGWAALATQRSTRHVVDPTFPKTHGPSDGLAQVADPNTGNENPVRLEDQLANRAGAAAEREQLKNVNTGASRSLGDHLDDVDALNGAAAEAADPDDTEDDNVDDDSNDDDSEVQDDEVGDEDGEGEDTEANDEDDAPYVAKEFAPDSTKTDEENAEAKSLHDAAEATKVADDATARAEAAKSADPAVKPKPKKATGIKKRV